MSPELSEECMGSGNLFQGVCDAAPPKALARWEQPGTPCSHFPLGGGVSCNQRVGGLGRTRPSAELSTIIFLFLRESIVPQHGIGRRRCSMFSEPSSVVCGGLPAGWFSDIDLRKPPFFVPLQAKAECKNSSHNAPNEHHVAFLQILVNVLHVYCVAYSVVCILKSHVCVY